MARSVCFAHRAAWLRAVLLSINASYSPQCHRLQADGARPDTIDRSLGGATPARSKGTRTPKEAMASD